MNFKATLAAFALAFASTLHAAETTGPEEAIKAKTAQVLSDLSAHQTQADANTDAGLARLKGTLKDVLTPIMDVDAAAKLLLGQRWRDATEDQQNRFKDALGAMLLSTYTDTLASAGSITIDVMDAKPSSRADRSSVPARATLESGRTLEFVYRMRKHGDDWKIYDIKVDGISMLRTYRSSVQAAVERDGLQAVIETLEERYGIQS